MMSDILLATGRITSAWVDFFIMVGALALIAIGALIWVFYFRRTRRRHRRKHRRNREQRSVNPTLAQTGGLPPARPPDPPDATTSQPP